MKKTLILALLVVLISSTSAFAVSQSLNDVEENEWYADSVMELVEKDIIEGYEDGTFRPAVNVNRAEIAVMLDRMLTHMNDQKIHNTVNFFTNVEPEQNDKQMGAVEIGMNQATAEDLNELIRPDGGKVLIVNKMRAFHILPESDEPFSVVGLLSCTDEDSTRGFGNGMISVSGLETMEVTYDPGIVVHLTEDGNVCIRSFIQSTDITSVEVNGYLMDRPEGLSPAGSNP